ncbi:hypothetical protein [Poriferisphaera sp. WC338]|uniref:hypothetical protein n=1 Tax=Poriferisphaera sp. WC338 TaxID=3425129 RepID=UPI003D816482
MLKLATLIENPGEPLIDSRYHDPSHLKQLGFNGVVLYPTTALSGLNQLEDIKSDEMKRWIKNHTQCVEQEIEKARAAELAVYLFYDMLVLPADIVDLSPASINCKNRTDTICPASSKAYDLCMQALETHLQNWRHVDGIVLRFGDTDAPRLPYLLGNDIYSPYCPRCSNLSKLDRITEAINRAYDIIVNHHQKKLIVRAWNVRPNGLHDSIELAQKLAAKLPGDENDDRLILSFKFTHTDFWRYQTWNKSSLQFGNRPILYELQCQREFEGKGSFCNWQYPIWQNGMPETVEQEQSAGIKNISKHTSFSGIFAWVRGGGWGGPFISSESWIDANVYAAIQLADNPETAPEDVASHWVREQLNIQDESVVQIIVKILLDSESMVRQAFYIEPFARKRIDGWYPNADWIQDDVFDADALARLLEKLTAKEAAKALAEKQNVLDMIGRARTQLQQAQNKENRSKIEPLVTSLIYAESLIETITLLIDGLIKHKQFRETRDDSLVQAITQRILSAQSHWNHHTQRIGTLPGAPTPFREKGFWELTQNILASLQS